MGYEHLLGETDDKYETKHLSWFLLQSLSFHHSCTWITLVSITLNPQGAIALL